MLKDSGGEAPYLHHKGQPTPCQLANTPIMLPMLTVLSTGSSEKSRSETDSTRFCLVSVTLGEDMKQIAHRRRTPSSRFDIWRRLQTNKLPHHLTLARSDDCKSR